ncbi:hypothetical protein BpHYR1_002431 [Brachionus plicatilis]|uniref:Uncharacterized protein n=1 Tax=Brachionus plicatilis TaxID=10195 RepID=A0A3M7QWM0_BRAPC|nr:hypothetical protein BpHYR1_002431 [Brachionus plicatilis]
MAMKIASMVQNRPAIAMSMIIENERPFRKSKKLIKNVQLKFYNFSISDLKAKLIHIQRSLGHGSKQFKSNKR